MKNKRLSRVAIIDIVRRACSKIRHNINTHKVSKATDLNWLTVKTALEVLNICNVIKKENGKYIYLGLIEDIRGHYFNLVKENQQLKKDIEKLEENIERKEFERLKNKFT